MSETQHTNGTAARQRGALSDRAARRLYDQGLVDARLQALEVYERVAAMPGSDVARDLLLRELDAALALFREALERVDALAGDAGDATITRELGKVLRDEPDAAGADLPTSLRLYQQIGRVARRQRERGDERPAAAIEWPLCNVVPETEAAAVLLRGITSGFLDSGRLQASRRERLRRAANELQRDEDDTERRARMLRMVTKIVDDVRAGEPSEEWRAVYARTLRLASPPSLLEYGARTLIREVVRDVSIHFDQLEVADVVKLLCEKTLAPASIAAALSLAVAAAFGDKCLPSDQPVDGRSRDAMARRRIAKLFADRARRPPRSRERPRW